MQSDMVERGNRCVRSLDKTSDERLSRISFHFVAIGSFTADGGLLQPTGSVKTTPRRTRFRSVNSARNSCTRQN